jgi:type I restriction enzyme S subunit
MADLRTVPIADLGRVVTGKTPPSAQPELFGELYPFLTPTDIDGIARYIEPARFLSSEGRDYQQRLMLPERAVCVVCIGATIGKVCMTARPSFTNQQINSVVVNEQEHDPFFVYHLMTRLRDKLKANAGGAATPIINKTAFSEIGVSVPPLSVQRPIAVVLSAYDDLIENNTRRIQILEQMAQAIYREWFVHFRFPSHAKVKRVASPLGKVPQGWEVKKLRDICQRVDYGYTASANKEPVGPRFLRITDIVPSVIDWASVPYCELDGDGIDKYQLQAGDIVIARTGATTGYAKRLNKRHPESVFASYLVRIRVQPGNSSHLFGVAIESDDYKQFIKTNLSGSAQPQANAQVLTSLPIVLPPQPLQAAFTEIVEPMLDQKEILEVKNANLRRTRDLLLPKLISGELDVSEMDIKIGI